MNDEATIPVQVDDISVDWLNDVLGDDIGTVADFTLTHFGEGVGILGELARISLTYAPGESGPASVIAKCATPSVDNQFLAVAMGFYLREVNFYREVAGNLDVRVPRAYHAAASKTGVPFILLLEDIEGAQTPNQLEGLSLDEVRRIIASIVPLHTQFWGNDAVMALDWLPPMNNDMYKGGQAMAVERFPGFVEHFGDRIPDHMIDTTRRACERYSDLLDYVVSVGTPTFTHTDCRAENYLFGGPDGDDVTTVIDFQLATRHVGMWDVTNLLAGSMDPELRRAHEVDLIAEYVDRVRAAGIDFSVEQATQEYRMSLLQQTTAQVISSDLDGGNERGAALLEQLHLRPILAAIDNDVASVLDEF
jgi:aminoglycoside/choline kinase family phosphotransferase